MCGGIHMSRKSLRFSYDLLWGERTLCSIANLTRKDAHEFMAVVPQVPVRTTTHSFRLEQANEALNQRRGGKLQGTAVFRYPRPQFRGVRTSRNPSSHLTSRMTCPSPDVLYFLCRECVLYGWVV